MNKNLNIEGLPDVQTAYNTINDRVWGRVFLHKLASADIAPQNDAEYQTLLQLAAASQDMPQPVENRFAKAAQWLQQQQGADVEVQRRYKEAAESEMADQLLADPEIFGATLSLKLAEHLSLLNQSTAAAPAAAA